MRRKFPSPINSEPPRRATYPAPYVTAVCLGIAQRRRLDTTAWSLTPLSRLRSFNSDISHYRATYGGKKPFEVAFPSLSRSQYLARLHHRNQAAESRVPPSPSLSSFNLYLHRALCNLIYLPMLLVEEIKLGIAT